MEAKARSSGEASRRAILARALALSAEVGPEGLTIGMLASALGMSKSGVFAPFGSKEALDIAVVDAAADEFTRAVTAPAHAAPAGVARLAALVEGWLAEAEAGSPTLVVLGLSRPGAAAPVRERLGAWRGLWQSTLAAEVTEARAARELAAGTDAGQTAFEIEALLAAAAHAVETGRSGAVAAARRAIEIRLQQLAAGR